MMPDVWRVVEISSSKQEKENYNEIKQVKKYLDSLRTMAKAAVDRSGGQLRVFAGKLFVNEELMLYIVKRCFL
jgi:hypothetical protein